MLGRTVVAICLLILIASNSKGRTVDLDPFTFAGQHFSGTLFYEVENAYAGNQNLIVIVVMETKGENKLKLESFELPLDPSLFQIAKISELSSTDKSTNLVKTEYKYQVKINEKAEPRIYPLTLTFSFPGEKNIRCLTSLYVGVRSNGKLDIVQGQDDTIELLTGVENPLRVDFVNHYADYTANIRSIAIESSPAGLIEPVELSENVAIGPQQREALHLKCKAAPMSFTSFLRGFNDSSSLVLTVKYDDGYGRTVSTFAPTLRVRIRPRDRVLVLAMIVGVIIGALIKLYLQRLQQKGLLKPRDVLIAVLITSAIGLVIALIALVGRIKIIAFEQTGSYDNPAVIFIISLAGAVGGSQLLSSLLKTKGATP